MSMKELRKSLLDEKENFVIQVIPPSNPQIIFQDEEQVEKKQSIQQETEMITLNIKSEEQNNFKKLSFSAKISNEETKNPQVEGEEEKNDYLLKVPSNDYEKKAQQTVADKLIGSTKLLDFVESEERHSIAVSSSIHLVPKLSAANIRRLSQFHSALLSNRNSKLLKQKQSLYQQSGLNFSYEDVLQDIVEIEDGKLIVQTGDQIRKITIGPGMMKYLGEEVEDHVSEISKPLYTRINHYLSWFLVFYATINGACIPPWIMSIPAEKYMRISWRFFMQTIMMIPFLMYEYRNLAPENKQQYTLSYIFRLEHIKKVYLVAFSSSIWFTMVLFAFEWNFISHALVLSGLQQFCFSIQRMLNKQENHSYEPAGQAMVIFGLICVFIDTLTYDVSEIPPSTKNYRNYLLIFRKPWQRLVIGNFTALLVSFLMFKMARHQGEARKVYPQFLQMALVFFFTSLNMTMSSYFFAGSDLVQKDSFWGWLGLFTSTQFSGFLYMSIILGMGNFVTQTLISKIFEPIIPATVALFEPIFSTIILQLVGIQIIPRGLACLGYVFILPGLFVIVIGQHLLGVKIKQEEETQMRQQLQDEIKRLQALQDEQNEKNKIQEVAEDKEDKEEKNDDQKKDEILEIPHQEQTHEVTHQEPIHETPIHKQSEKILRYQDQIFTNKLSLHKLSEFISQARDSLQPQHCLKQTASDHHSNENAVDDKQKKEA